MFLLLCVVWIYVTALFFSHSFVLSLALLLVSYGFRYECREQVLYQLLWSTHTRMCKWEKFHWTWHHIIHSKQTSDSHVKYSFARLGISFFCCFDFGSLLGMVLPQQRHALHSIELYTIYQCIASKWLILSMPFRNLKCKFHREQPNNIPKILRLFITNEIKMEMIFTTGCYWKFFFHCDWQRRAKRQIKPQTDTSNFTWNFVFNALCLTLTLTTIKWGCSLMHLNWKISDNARTWCYALLLSQII